MTASNSSGVMFLNDLSRRMPALLMTMSTLPNASSAVWTIASAPSGVATLSGLATASPPFFLISSTTCCAGPGGGADTGPVAAEVVDDDLGAARGELERVPAAEAVPGPGHDRHAAVVAQFRHPLSPHIAATTPLGDNPGVTKWYH